MALADTFWAVVGLLFGVGFIWASVQSAGQSWAVLRAPRTEARGVSEGPARLRGVVRIPEESSIGPLTGKPCALVRWEVRQGAGEGRLETELARGYEAVPFRLDDGTGTVRVVVTGEADLFDLDLEIEDGWDNPVYEVPYPEPRPDSAAALEDRADIQDWPTVGGLASEWIGVKRRYHEWRVEAGDEVTVYGRARDTSEGVIIEPGETFVLATDGLVRRLWARTLVYLGVAAFFLVGALSVLGRL